MLFDINKNGLSHNLIYTTPTHYPVEGVGHNTDVLEDFIITQHVEVEELLKYLKYGVDLTQGDLDQIYRKFVVRDWWLEAHMELFGWEKLYDEKTGVFTGWYENSGPQILPRKIYDKLSWISSYPLNQIMA